MVSLSVPRDEVPSVQDTTPAQLSITHVPILAEHSGGSFKRGRGLRGHRGGAWRAQPIQDVAPPGRRCPPPQPAAAGTRWHAGPGPRRRPQVLP